MKFDDLLKYLGEFGPYQKRVYFLLCLCCVSHGMRMVVMVFILNTPEHRCAIPHYPNDTYGVTSESHQVLLNRSVPSQDSCHVFKSGNYSYDAENRPINATLEKCNARVFDTSTFSSTVSSQFSLVCDNALKKSHATMVFYGGFLIGVFVLGAVSDIIGRKLCLYLSLSLLLVLGTALAFAQDFVTFCVVNFFVGATTTGIFSSAFVIGIELVGPSKRTYTGMFIQLFFSFGVVALSALAYFIREWQQLEIVITVHLVVFYLMWCFIPESPRWQIQRGHFAKARKTVEHAARVNKVQIPESVMEKVIPSRTVEIEVKVLSNGDIDHCHEVEVSKDGVNGYRREENREQTGDVTKDDSCVKLVTPAVNVVDFKTQGGEILPEDASSGKAEAGKLVDLFKSRVLFIRTSIIFFNWTIVSLTFYALNFNVGNLGAGSIFLNFFLAGLVEFPAHITTILSVDRPAYITGKLLINELYCITFGRKKVHFAMMALSGVSCLLCVLSIVFASSVDQWITVALAMAGKFGAAGGFGTIYMYSSEIYPTVIRNSALGASSSWARVGAMLAPYVAAQGTKSGGALGRGVPLLICGCLILCAAALSVFLPETLNRKLPETIMDARLFGKQAENKT